MWMPQNQFMIRLHWFRWWLGAVLLFHLINTHDPIGHPPFKHYDIVSVVTGFHVVEAQSSSELRQIGRHCADDVFKCIFLNEYIYIWISLKISLKFVPKFPINNTPSLVLIMALCRSGDKPLSEPMMVSLLTHTSLGFNESTDTKYARCGGSICACS